jgi:hypothetical protein
MNVWDQDRKNFIIDTMSKYFSVVNIESESVDTHSGKNFLLYIEK